MLVNRYTQSVSGEGWFLENRCDLLQERGSGVSIKPLLGTSKTLLFLNIRKDLVISQLAMA